VSQNENWYTLNFPLYQVIPQKLTEQMRSVINYEPVFTGFAHNILFMEFADEDALYGLQPDLEALKKIDCRALAATARGRKYDFLSRYFAPKVGINEDPVCASAHCRLIPYWSEKLGKKDMMAYQASSRGGVLKCRNLGNRVLISGEAVTVFKGKIADNQLSELKHVA
jgi:predicted PhzF superfamily epimerase YddE/YHI9